MRYLRPDPVADDLVDTVLHAATCASSPNNSQSWTFVVVRDAEQRRRIGEAVAPFGGRIDPAAGADATERRTYAGARHLAETLARAPVIIFVCVRNDYPPGRPSERLMWSAGYAASQNLIVAARSLGLGTVFTTFHQVNEAEVRSILGVPDEVHIATTIPLGWPERDFGPVTRKPLAEVVRYDRYR